MKNEIFVTFYFRYKAFDKSYKYPLKEKRNKKITNNTTSQYKGYSMNITPISESAVVCSLPPPASLQQQRQLWAFANQLQSRARYCRSCRGNE